MKLKAIFGTEFVEEVDKTLGKLKAHQLVYKVFKRKIPNQDAFTYIICFTSIDGIYLFGKTRPQQKI